MNETDNIRKYILHLADNSLILGHRNSEWCGHGPVLEEDIALTNIALDQVGQARLYYQYAAGLGESGETEDSLAYLRDNREFRNCLLAELPKGHWGFTIMRQFLFSAYQYPYLIKMQDSRDETLASIAAKALKEVAYHLRWSGEWVIRLGDGTALSHDRMQEALEQLWEYTGEWFVPSEYELALPGIAADLAGLEETWKKKITGILHEAGLEIPEPGRWMQSGGKEGRHTEHLGHLLAEMQFLQRAYPHATW